jgi:hypothetical protein
MLPDSAYGKSKIPFAGQHELMGAMTKKHIMRADDSI